MAPPPAVKNFHQVSGPTSWESVFSNSADGSTASANNHWAEGYMVRVCRVDSLSLEP